MPQITARLSPEVRQRFETYAVSVGLNGSSLARLLIVRELRQKRRLWGQRTDEGIRSGNAKLTAHSCSAEIVDQFDAYAKASQLSRAAAAKLVFERELRDKWLINAMEHKPP
jgi:hypothetical protein